MLTWPTVYTPGNPGVPQMRGPNETIPTKYEYGFSRLLKSSAMSGPPLDAKHESISIKLLQSHLCHTNLPIATARVLNWSCGNQETDKIIAIEAF